MLDIVKSLSELMGVAGLSPQAQGLAPKAETAEGFLQLLEQEKMAPDMVNVLAHGMPEQKSVLWACESSELVKEQMSQLDLSAANAAREWAMNPTSANQNAAAEAAAMTDFQGPGAWAAQGAAWAYPGAPASGQEFPGLSPEAVEMMKLAGKDANTGNAVAGSVKLSAAMKNDPAFMKTLTAGEFQAPAFPDMPSLEAPSFEAPSLAAAPPEPPAVTPEQASKNVAALAPFIAIGMAIAAKQVDWNKI